MPVYRWTSASLVICAEAVVSVHLGCLLSINWLPAKSSLSSWSIPTTKSELYLAYTEGLAVDVAIPFSNTRRCLFCGDLHLECSNRVREKVGVGFMLVCYPSWKWLEQTTTLSLDFPIGKSSLPFWTCLHHVAIIESLGLWNDNFCMWVHFEGYLRSLSPPPT